MKYIQLTNTDIGLSDVDKVPLGTVGNFYGNNVLFKDSMLNPLFKYSILRHNDAMVDTILTFIPYKSVLGYQDQFIATTKNIYRWDSGLLHKMIIYDVNAYEWDYVNTPNYLIVTNINTGLLTYNVGRSSNIFYQLIPKNKEDIKCKYVSYFKDHLFLAYMKESNFTIPQRVRWSGIGDVENYSYYESDAGFIDLMDDTHRITGLFLYKDNLYIFKEQSVTIVMWTGGGFNFKVLLSDMGSKSITVTEYGICFICDNSIFLLSEGGQLSNLSSLMEDTFIKLNINTYLLYYSVEMNILLLYSPDALDVYVYNFTLQNWTMITLPCSVAIINTFKLV